MPERPQQAFVTLAGPAEAAREIRHSRFLGRAARVDGPEEAAAWLERVREPEANHNAWAWRTGERQRFSDDGEPGGTAGRPILAAIEGAGLDHVAVVVARWFGGVKLGAGGLVRAYGGTAAACLRAAERVEVRPRVTLTAHVPFAHTAALFPLLERFAAERGAEAWDAAGLTLTVTIDVAQRDALARALRDATRGEATLG